MGVRWDMVIQGLCLVPLLEEDISEVARSLARGRARVVPEEEDVPPPWLCPPHGGPPPGAPAARPDAAHMVSSDARRASIFII